MNIKTMIGNLKRMGDNVKEALDIIETMRDDGRWHTNIYRLLDTMYK